MDNQAPVKRTTGN